MAVILRATRTFQCPFPRPTTLRSSPLSHRLYASNSSGSEPEGSGVIKKADKNAKPKILEHVPPAEETSDVKKHNEDFEDRPDRATNMIDEKGRPVTGKMPSKGKTEGYN